MKHGARWDALLLSNRSFANPVHHDHIRPQ
jgi:hypothetical protein